MKARWSKAGRIFRLRVGEHLARRIHASSSYSLYTYPNRLIINQGTALIFRIDDADRERSFMHPEYQLHDRREAVRDDKMPKSNATRSISSSKKKFWPGPSGLKRICSRDIHAELEELIKASTEEDGDSEEPENTEDTEAKKYRRRQGQFSPLYEPEIRNENEGRRKCRTRRNRRVSKPEEEQRVYSRAAGHGLEKDTRKACKRP